MRNKDEWSVVITNKYTRGSDGVSMETIVIPGFTSEELANKALEKVLYVCRSPYDRTDGVVIKVKEHKCLTK